MFETKNFCRLTMGVAMAVALAGCAFFSEPVEAVEDKSQATTKTKAKTSSSSSQTKTVKELDYKPVPKKKPANSTSATATQTVTAKAKETQAVTTYAASAGVKTCLGRVAQITDFLAGENNAGTFFFIPADKTKANTSLVTMASEIKTPGALTYAGVSYAPVGSNGCGAAYEAITYRHASCQDVAKKDYSTLKVSGKLGKEIASLGDGPYMRIYLMPVSADDAGCVIIKKEVVY